MMLDRFKFRAWDESTELMSDIFTLWSVVSSGAVVMQCTGLKDKNGKLIFEGDIVKKKGFRVNLLVSFEEDEGGFVGKSTKTSLCYELGKSLGPTIEIIGNKYENPELLGENND